MLLFVADSLIVNQSFIGFERNQGNFEVAEKPFYQVGYQMRILDVLKILIVPLAEFIEGLIFLVNGDTFSEQPFLVKAFRLGAKIVNQKLDDDGDANVSYFVILEGKNFLRDESIDSELELIFFLPLLLSHLLAFNVHSVAHQRRPSFHHFWKLRADFFRNKSHKVLDLYF